MIDGREPTEIFTSELDGSPIGMMQRYRNLDYPDWDQQMQVPAAAGIDYFIGESSLVGRGLGPQIISRFVEQVFADYQDINAVIVGVLEANRQSWRALEKAGFERLRSQHLDSEDPWDRGPGYVYERPREQTVRLPTCIGGPTTSN